MMSDRRLKRIFKEAAELAKSVPEEFREVAFSRAVDVLVARDAVRDVESESEPEHVKGSTEKILAASIDAIGQAAGRVGVGGLSADEIGTLLEQRFGITADNDVIARVLKTSDSIVDRVSGSGTTLFHLLRASAPKDNGEGEPEVEVNTEQPRPYKILTDLVAKGFFNTSRTVRDVAMYLQRKGFEITSRELTPVMLRLIQAGLLHRVKNAQGRYEYKSV